MNDHRAEGNDALNSATAGLAETAQRHLCCFLPRIDAALWSSPTFIDTLRGFVTARPQRQVRMLLVDADDLPRQHPALIALAQRLPSLIEFRRHDPDYAQPAVQSFIVNDQGELLSFDTDEHLAATLTTAGERARPLASRFNDAWERARPMSELRALGI